MKYDIHRGFIVKPIRLHGIPRKPRVGEGGEGARFRVTARKYNTFIVGDAVMLAP